MTYGLSGTSCCVGSDELPFLMVFASHLKQKVEYNQVRNPEGLILMNGLASNVHLDNTPHVGNLKIRHHY